MLLFRPPCKPYALAYGGALATLSIVATRVSSRATTGALVLWLLLQLGALALAAGQVPLCRGFARPAERLAAQEMIVVQVAAAAMLFPLLLRDWRSTLLMIAASVPMLQLAGFLSGRGARQMLCGMVYVSAWLVALGLWRRALNCRRGELIASAIATTVAVGGPVLWYLRAEFTGDAKADWARDGLAGPVMGALSLLANGPRASQPWLVIGLALATALAAIGLRFFSRQVINKFSTREPVDE